MSPVPGSTFRRALFWAHLACGVTAGLLILLMSVTGVLLAYERQVVDAAARRNRVELAPGDASTRCRFARRHGTQRAAAGCASESHLQFRSCAACRGPGGRDQSLLLNPYTRRRHQRRFRVLAEILPDRRGLASLAGRQATKHAREPARCREPAVPVHHHQWHLPLAASRLAMADMARADVLPDPVHQLPRCATSTGTMCSASGCCCRCS